MTEDAGSVEGARALLAAGRLREIVNAPLNASPEELKKACRAAQIRCHPDKGGNAELFKIVRTAVEQLLGLDVSFEGEIPGWAKVYIENLAELDADRRRWEAKRLILGQSIARCRTEKGRAKTRAEVERTENLIESVEAEIREYKARYRQEYEAFILEQERARQRQEKRERNEAAAAERREREAKRAGGVMRKRKERGLPDRFPSLPKAIRNTQARNVLDDLCQRYRRACEANRKRVARGGETSSAVELLEEARAHVLYWCAVARDEALDTSGRFPQADQPRPEELERLRQLRTKLKDRLRRARTDETREELQSQADRVLNQTLALVAVSAQGSHIPG